MNTEAKHVAQMRCLQEGHAKLQECKHPKRKSLRWLLSSLIERFVISPMRDQCALWCPHTTSHRRAALLLALDVILQLPIHGGFLYGDVGGGQMGTPAKTAPGDFASHR